jgi:hypothetical protein
MSATLWASSDHLVDLVQRTDAALAKLEVSFLIADESAIA